MMVPNIIFPDSIGADAVVAVKRDHAIGLRFPQLNAAEAVALAIEIAKLNPTQLFDLEHRGRQVPVASSDKPEDVLARFPSPDGQWQDDPSDGRKGARGL